MNFQIEKHRNISVESLLKDKPKVGGLSPKVRKQSQIGYHQRNGG
jgi:hypothetical protein